MLLSGYLGRLDLVLGGYLGRLAYFLSGYLDRLANSPKCLPPYRETICSKRKVLPHFGRAPVMTSATIDSLTSSSEKAGTLARASANDATAKAQGIMTMAQSVLICY